MENNTFEISFVIGDYKSFLDKIFLNLEKAGFSENEFRELDHVGYRVENLETYEELKIKFKSYSFDSREVEISGRPITVYKLKSPLEYGKLKIKCLELLAPKATKKYENGLEHAEFVITDTFQEFLKKHENLTFNFDSYSREINPEIKLPFENCSVKFHTQSLLNIRGM